MKYDLRVSEGCYHADHLIGLLWEILKHRAWHFCRGDGWID